MQGGKVVDFCILACTKPTTASTQPISPLITQGRERIEEEDLYAAMENKAIEAYSEMTGSPKPGQVSDALHGSSRSAHTACSPTLPPPPISYDDMPSL